MRFTLLLLALLICCPDGAWAKSDRMKVDALEYPWSAVGRLNAGGRGYCSAVLISERHLLTAAHCLWNRIQDSWWPATSLHFVAGYQGGEAPLHSLVKSYVLADGAVMTESKSDASRDWAVVELADPLGRQAGWLQVDSDGAEKTVWVGELGYRAESPHAMTLEFGCRIVAHSDGNALFWHDCAGAKGESGGPVLAFRSDGPHVVGITSRIAVGNGLTLTGVVDLKRLADPQQFPKAAAAFAAAHNGPGHPPASGGPARPLPSDSIRRLSVGKPQSPSLELLSQLLNTAAAR
ncbi:MAG TPA: trypsin-like serine protease [Rhodospirillaceae bacterium]|nr:trypsin-like serine protease [Rhodospirillaceae bacterium]